MQEATIIICDNSEWMRNGDFAPTRYAVQSDAASQVCGAKTGSNPENCVGLITSAGSSPEATVSLTTDVSKIHVALSRMSICGSQHFSTSVQIAQIALKHRQNKIQSQRIIAFVGSPLYESAAELKRLGRKMKKCNVAVDVISFGEIETNTPKLEAFISSVQTLDNCRLLTIPSNETTPATRIIDSIASSGILGGGHIYSSSSGTGAGGMGNDDDFPFGVDPDLDPELALALQLSMEEENARRNQTAGDGVNSGAGVTDAAVTNATAPEPPSNDVNMEAEFLTEDEQLMRAIQLSMADSNAGNENTASNDDEDVNDLPGVDSNDARIRDASSRKSPGSKK